MDLQDTGVIVAMLGVMGGFVFTWRGQQQDKELSEAAASRSEAAARLTADNTERVLKALEVIAAKDFTSGPSVLPPARVKWTLVHHSNEGYRLENIGDATAYDVRVASHESLRLHGLDQAGSVLAPGEAFTFIASPSLATSDRTITVRWRDNPNTTKQHEWRYPLPPGA